MANIPKVKLKVNLQDLFGSKVDISDGLKESIGQAIIDRIVHRTEKMRVDKNGDPLGTYSKSYRDSLDFKVLKGNQRTVNLLATGDMLSALTVLETSSNTITIGFDDTEQNAKAYGHISGMEGHPFLEGKVQKRDFMGLPENDLDKIASKFADEVTAVDNINGAQNRRELDERVLDFINELESQIVPSEDIG